eukprot:GHVL01041940.1.p1 GENE.GHVL01041940.1~~GHVL01041940.1.p1  ORF type:complete len:163 (+),score=24.26 GHVL01041940.1:368-856(+)
MARHFEIDIVATRLNYYKDSTDWKPFHHDKHYDSASGMREDLTVGASFGASRALQFLHVASGTTFNFPQNNGDIFAFNSDVNRAFQHGVPRCIKPVGPRISIIVWGVRRQLTLQNSAKSERKSERNDSDEDRETCADTGIINAISDRMKIGANNKWMGKRVE